MSGTRAVACPGHATARTARSTGPPAPRDSFLNQPVSLSARQPPPTRAKSDRADAGYGRPSSSSWSPTEVTATSVPACFAES